MIFRKPIWTVPFLLLLLLHVRVDAQTSLPGTREEKAGWIVLHLSGKPSEIGYQYGSLLAKEIDDAHHALRLSLKQDTGRDWKFYRETARKLFATKLDEEYREEIAGIAAGLKASGYAYDATDILAHNAWIEIAGYYLPVIERKGSERPRSRAPMACSAFIATGSQTTDGKIVMGHNFWWDYMLGQRWNVVLDITPQKGNRLLMDVFPGFIHSGSDFAINSAGLVVCETTISGFTGFDVNGLPEFMRARKAVQYADSLDSFVKIMTEGNNGGYANTWLFGDTNTSEIGKLELGLKNVIYSHTTDGAYIGANFPEDPKLIAEECTPGSDKNESSVGRKMRWQKLLKESRGKVDSKRGQMFLGDTYDELQKRDRASISTLCGRGDLGIDPGPHGATNAKIVTSEMAKSMTFLGRVGFPDGSSFSANEFFQKAPNYRWMKPYLRDMPVQPWTKIEAKRE